MYVSFASGPFAAAVILQLSMLPSDARRGERAGGSSRLGL
jgi:hypothetical protein